jgi:hypothetical protein
MQLDFHNVKMVYTLAINLAYCNVVVNFAHGH